MISAVIYTIGAFVYIVFGSGETQPFNNAMYEELSGEGSIENVKSSYENNGGGKSSFESMRDDKSSSSA